MDNYYLDRKIISILFRITDENLVNETDLLFADILLRLNETYAREFLREKGIPGSEIDEFFSSEEGRNEKIRELLGSEEFLGKIIEGRNSLIKKVYDKYLPDLSVEEKKELDDYLLLIEARNKEQLSDMNMMLDFLKTRDQLITENKITQADFDNAVENALGKLSEPQSTPQSPTNTQQPN